MKNVARVVLCALLVAGCGGSKAQRSVDELQSKVDALNARVKVLEDDLLAANKKIIQHEQAMQLMHDQMRDIQTDFDKIRLGQTSVR
jgi:outer membrane murein-binding lipoprotein Lpp